MPEPAGAAQTSQSEGRSRHLACLRLRTGSGATPGPASSRLSPGTVSDANFSPHDSHSHVCLITPDESKPEVPSKPRRGALALTSNAKAPLVPGAQKYLGTNGLLRPAARNH